jgi:mannose-1-phosphate guanylyltransferase / mannose-6-phosphate isomerase
MLQETALRAAALPGAAPPIVVSNEEHRFLVAEQMREIDIVPAAHILEPAGRNTAPAIAAAALALGSSADDDTLLILPSDHVIGQTDRFAAAMEDGARLAAQGRLVAFGILPTSPATGYGYIRRGLSHDGSDRAFEVAEFVEKPDAPRASAFLASGEHYWNSGMFMFRAEVFLRELRAFRPDILSAVESALATGEHDMDFLRVNKEAFERCPSDSIDYAVMERTQYASVVPARFGWSDIGSWSALWEISESDAEDNVLRGDVHVDQSTRCYLRSESRLLAAIGVRDLIVVETSDAVLVAHKDKAQDVKHLVEHLKSTQRTEHHSHTRVFRPWGYYESIDTGASFQVKRLMLKTGAKISLQRHQRRAEHWVVVAGRARVTRNNDELLLGPNESTYIPVGTTHRLENVGEDELFVIEVQSGEYLGEDDIERFADDYQRT